MLMLTTAAYVLFVGLACVLTGLGLFPVALLFAAAAALIFVRPDVPRRFTRRH